MPRHRSLNLKKFIDSIPEPLIHEVRPTQCKRPYKKAFEKTDSLNIVFYFGKWAFYEHF
jgi:hypothetical protein